MLSTTRIRTRCIEGGRSRRAFRINGQLCSDVVLRLHFQACPGPHQSLRFRIYTGHSGGSGELPSRSSD